MADASAAAYLLLATMLVSSGRAIDLDYTPAIGLNGTRCYSDFRQPQRCIPGFENPAFNNQIHATNTCGDNGPIEYCVQTGISGIAKSCDICYPGQHQPAYLTDDSKDQQTWWQSETMNEDIQYPNQVNLTLNLGKAFDITYVRIWFHSPRPESFAILKRVCENCPWVPYQFYSASCRDTYGLPDSTQVIRGEETRALCTSEYSEISPLRDGNIAFATLEHRPSAYTFDSSPELQEWVTATDIRIVLDRLNTFGDEVFGDTQVLRSYFYAIVEVSVGARCKCNGHASECVLSTGLDGSQRRVCKCEHFTDGPDCNICLPFYNDAPWGRASEKDPHECKPCNCNGFSDRCFFDKDLYERTGHGGHCMDCTANRDGPNCERCRENYYQRDDHYCISCDCDPVGSRSLQCNSEGKCQCKPGVTGQKCDVCEANHYDFGQHGCKNCGCSEAGSLMNKPNCDSYTGVCSCKENVEGKRCRECKPGYFNLDMENEFGCTPCFCYGHSAECQSAPGYSRYQIESTFSKSSERWRAVTSGNSTVDIQYNGPSQSIAATSRENDVIYFFAPERFLGDQRASYNQLLQFTLRVGENRAIPTPTDIVLEGAGAYITSHIFAQSNSVPSIQSQEYKFRLHENQIYGWSPRLSPRAYMSILTDLTAIKIRATYTSGGVGFLEHFRLETASRGVAGKSAMWVEQCSCPQGYVGQYCESCAPGSRHSPSLGPFMPCVPCDCNKHADICDSETGRCICQHNTAGEHCERCARGYYGNALGGTTDDCLPCGCPNGGACIQLDEYTVCVECPAGYTGHRCDACSDGYFGDPTGRYGPKIPCQPCECNLNIDANAIGNCNTTSGECLKCIHNTGGPRCDRCLSGYYGDALALPKGDCQRCQCMPLGTVEGMDGSSICDQITGTCSCKTHVQGRNCDVCEEGYWNIEIGDGCTSCNCDSIGSLNHTCNIRTGQCFCRTGITGLRCDQCESLKYGFSIDGCKNCDCDHIGSKDLQCDPFGQCPCLENVEGRRCNRCKENKYDRQRGCIDCPDCYNLVRDASHLHTTKLQKLKSILDEIERNPTVIDDGKFEEQLHDVQEDVDDLNEQAKTGMGGGDEKSLKEKLDEIAGRQKEITRTLGDIEESIDLAKQQDSLARANISNTKNTIKTINDVIEDAMDELTTDGKASLEKAKERAEKFGQQSEKMTLIAQEARELADNLDQAADDITLVAAEAKNKSIQAYDLAKNVTDQQKNITQEIRSLRGDISATENKLVRVKQWSVEAHNKSAENKNKALALLNDVRNLIIPDVNIEEMKKEADRLRKESLKIINETEILVEKNEMLMKEIREQLIDAKDLLTKGNERQDIANDLMLDIDLAKAQAEKAVELGYTTLNEAKEMYETLSQFDKQVEESKEAALQALEKIPEIEQLIGEAEEKTEEAEGSLLGAKENADNALDRAKTAGALATNASQTAAEIRKEVEALNKNVTNLEKESELMSDRVKNTELELKSLIAQTESNGTLINVAKEKVGRAQKDTQEASKKVNEIRKDVEGILKELETLPDFNEDELNRLEAELKVAEQKVKEANLDELLKRLQKEHKEQHALVDAYNAEIAFLKAEVENIEQIANSLPDGCFKSVDLEP